MSLTRTRRWRWEWEWEWERECWQLFVSHFKPADFPLFCCLLFEPRANCPQCWPQQTACHCSLGTQQMARQLLGKVLLLLLLLGLPFDFYSLSLSPFHFHSIQCHQLDFWFVPHCTAQFWHSPNCFPSFLPPFLSSSLWHCWNQIEIFSFSSLFELHLPSLF